MNGMESLRQELSAAVAGQATTRRSPLRRGAPVLACALLAGGGVAYAAGSAWWSDSLRTSTSGQVAASTQQIDPTTESGLAILRRRQAPADRDSASGFALTGGNGQHVVRTGYVRELSAPVHGHPVVLIPTGSSERPSADDELCLWAQTSGDSGGAQCGTFRDVSDGKVFVVVGATPDPAREARRAANRRAQLNEADPSGNHTVTLHGDTYAPSETELTVVGLAPDGIESATVGNETVPVRDNAFVATISESADAAGIRVQFSAIEKP